MSTQEGVQRKCQHNTLGELRVVQTWFESQDFAFFFEFIIIILYNSGMYTIAKIQ